jgi:demethylmenaquinone methyltransferase/2-methoxy-6-polyprenyl-1,4-benzoquinol methylase
VRQGLLAKRAADIRGMFDRIAPRYDLLNRMLSLGQDRRWRRRVARRVAGARPSKLLDVCTGTGDLAFASSGTAVSFGCDFSFAMLARARVKARLGGRRLALIAADALSLPFSDASFDVVTVAFGVRNYERLDDGLRELLRVLGPGGTLLILEFSQPGGIFAPALGWWIRQVPPRVGRLVSGDREAYSYLTESVASFPDGHEMCAILERLGARPLDPQQLTGGVATLYEARKPEAIGSTEEA